MPASDDSHAHRGGRHVRLGAVRAWYAEHGDGEPLVLLHPGDPVATIAPIRRAPGGGAPWKEARNGG